MNEGRTRFYGHLDLEATLYSGQAFRWTAGPRDSHIGFIENVPVRVWSRPQALHWTSASPLGPAAIRKYFRLDDSHDAFLRHVRPDPYLAAAVARFPGLRLLRQDPWEMIVAFLISQNSNEARIRRTVDALARRLGAPMEFEGRVYHTFPAPGPLASVDVAEFRRLGLGYRAPYLQAAARLVASGQLDPHELPRLTYDEAFDRLLQVPGIGPKVADCILLYGCDHRQAFPTDVWVRRFIGETYLRRKRPVPSHDRIRDYALRRFGPEAGYAQHFLFHYRRAVGKLVRPSS